MGVGRVQKEGVVGFCVLAYLETSIERSNCSRLCTVVFLLLGYGISVSAVYVVGFNDAYVKPLG